MNISLIGMMGSGKTTIAKQLTVLLKNYTLIDTDSSIVESVGLSINEIFETRGEDEFRQIESKTLFDVLQNDNQIISTGGGIIKSEENIQLLKDTSLVFYLYADEDTLYERVKNNKERPLLNECDMKQKIHNLLSERVAKYEQAHFTIDTTLKTPDIIAKEIIKEIENYDKCRS